MRNPTTRLRLALPLTLCLALPATAAMQDDVDGEQAIDEEAERPAMFPDGMWGVYGRNNYACRSKRMAVEGKLGIRRNEILLEGEPYELGEIHQVSDKMIVADFVAPGGYSDKGVRMSFQLLRKNKLWHATYAGKPAPKIGYVRCRNRG